MRAAAAAGLAGCVKWRRGGSELGVEDQADGAQQQQDDAPHNELRSSAGGEAG